MKPLTCLLSLLVVISLVGCDNQTQGVIQPIMDDIMTEQPSRPEMPTQPRYITLGNRYEGGSFVDGDRIDVSQMDITHIPDSIFVIATHRITDEIVVLYTGRTPPGASHISDVINDTMNDLKIEDIRGARSADEDWLRENLINAILDADRFDSTNDNQGWVNADDVLNKVKLGVIFQDGRIGNAELEYKYTSDWTLGTEGIGIFFSKTNIGLNSRSSTTVRLRHFELQTIGGVRYIRYNPNKMSSEGSPRILVDDNGFCKQLVVDADSVSIEYEPDSIFVIGTYIADGRKVILYQGKTPGEAEFAFSLLRNVTEDINIGSAVSDAGEEYLGEWYNGEQLKNTLWLAENYAEAIVGSDALDGNIDGWAIAEIATSRLLNRIIYHPSGFESANLFYEVRPPNEAGENRLHMQFAMNYVVDESTKGIENCGRVSGYIHLPEFETKMEDNILYIRKVSD